MLYSPYITQCTGYSGIMYIIYIMYIVDMFLLFQLYNSHRYSQLHLSLAVVQADPLRGDEHDIYIHKYATITYRRYNK